MYTRRLRQCDISSPSLNYSHHQPKLGKKIGMSSRRAGTKNKATSAAIAAKTTPSADAPPSHPIEYHREHRAFLVRSLDRNDEDLAAIVDLNRSLHKVKQNIVDTCGEELLLDLGEGLLDLTPCGRDIMVALPRGDETAEEWREKKASMEEKIPIFDDHRMLCVDFLLRMKLRRRLINRFVRRLNRLAHAMDGEDISPPVIPKYGDLRLHLDSAELENFKSHLQLQKDARERVEAYRRENPGSLLPLVNAEKHDEIEKTDQETSKSSGIVAKTDTESGEGSVEANQNSGADLETGTKGGGDNSEKEEVEVTDHVEDPEDIAKDKDVKMESDEMYVDEVHVKEDAKMKDEVERGLEGIKDDPKEAPAVVATSTEGEKPEEKTKREDQEPSKDPKPSKGDENPSEGNGLIIPIEAKDQNVAATSVPDTAETVKQDAKVGPIDDSRPDESGEKQEDGNDGAVKPTQREDYSKLESADVPVTPSKEADVAETKKEAAADALMAMFASPSKEDDIIAKPNIEKSPEMADELQPEPKASVEESTKTETADELQPEPKASVEESTKTETADGLQPEPEASVEESTKTEMAAQPEPKEETKPEGLLTEQFLEPPTKIEEAQTDAETEKDEIKEEAKQDKQSLAASAANENKVADQFEQVKERITKEDKMDVDELPGGNTSPKLGNDLPTDKTKEAGTVAQVPQDGNEKTIAAAKDTNNDELSEKPVAGSTETEDSNHRSAAEEKAFEESKADTVSSASHEKSAHNQATTDASLPASTGDASGAKADTKEKIVIGKANEDKALDIEGGVEVANEGESSASKPDGAQSTPVKQEVPGTSVQKTSESASTPKENCLIVLPTPRELNQLEKDYEILKEFVDGYEKELDPVTGEITFKILKDGNRREDHELLQSGSGIGAAARHMSQKEKEVEFKRWQSAILSKIPEAPTFEELGMKNCVFKLEERRKRLHEKLKEEKHGKKKRRIMDVDGEDDKKFPSKQRNVGAVERKSPKKDKDAEEKEEVVTKKMKPLTLAPIPSFYESDLKRIRMIHSDLVFSSLYKSAQKRANDLTAEYNRAFASSNKLFEQKQRIEQKLQQIMHVYRQKIHDAHREHESEASRHRKQWLQDKLEYDGNRMKKYLPSAFGRTPTGTQMTQRLVNHYPAGTVPNIVSHCIADIIDGVVVKVQNSINDPPFRPYQAPPPLDVKSVIVDESTGATLAQHQARFQVPFQKEVQSISAKLTAAEEDRKRIWKKLTKAKQEFESPEFQMSARSRAIASAPPLRTSSAQAAPGVDPRTQMSSYAPSRGGDMRYAQGYAPSGNVNVTDSKYSAARVRDRIANDGTVAPVNPPVKTADGYYQRPTGRSRKGMDWDPVNGVWVPQR